MDPNNVLKLDLQSILCRSYSTVNNYLAVIQDEERIRGSGQNENSITSPNTHLLAACSQSAQECFSRLDLKK